MDSLQSKRVVIGGVLIIILAILVGGAIYFSDYLSTQLVGGVNTVTLSNQLKTDTLEPGEYELIFESNVRGGESFTRSTTFTVTGGLGGGSVPSPVPTTSPTPSPPPDPYGTAVPSSTPSATPNPYGAPAPLPLSPSTIQQLQN